MKSLDFLVGLWGCTSALVSAGEQRTPQKYHGRLLLKFEEKCLNGGNESLPNYIEKRLMTMNTEGTGTKRVVALNPKKLKQLFDSELGAATVATAKFTAQNRIDAAARFGLVTESIPTPASNRTLIGTPRIQREDEILSALHLMAAATVAGEDGAAHLLANEKKKDTNGLIKIIKEANRVELQSEQVKVLTSSLRITLPVSLEFLDGIKVVHNPVLGEGLLELAKLLPCLEFEPSADTSVLDERFGGPSEEGSRQLQELDSVYLDVIDYETLKLRMAEEAKGEGLSLNNGDQSKLFYMRRSDDPDVDKLWHLNVGTSIRGGASVYSGWAQLAKDAQFARHPEMKDQEIVEFDMAEVLEDLKHLKMVVALIDSGCERHADIVTQLWRNPKMEGCTDETFEGTGQDGQYPGNCVGYDFGEGKADPTTSDLVMRHGTSVSSLMVATANNKAGIVGVCPWCELVCLKTADEEGVKYTSAILKAINYIVSKNIRITNHSYGGYDTVKGSAYERTGYKAMDEAGIFMGTSAGNNGCDTDLDVDSDKCGPLGTYHTPSGFGFAGQLSVGAIDRRNMPATFSNFGAKSVDVFAPGEKVWAVRNAGSAAAAVSGTSYAAPITTGIAAVILSKYPHLNGSDLKKIIMASAAPNENLEGKSVVPGTVSLNRALAYASNFSAHESANPEPTGAGKPSIGTGEKPLDDEEADNGVEKVSKDGGNGLMVAVCTASFAVALLI